MTKENIENATLEAIYWWNRDEDYYHKYFSQLDNIYENKPALDFFLKKIFDMFLREYSVRRNLSQGQRILRDFFDEIFNTNFFEDVKNGRREVIDNVSESLKSHGKSTNHRHTKSLLSKVAFLINPHKFYLYDSLAKKAIWTIIKDDKSIKQIELENYECFVEQTELLRKSFFDKGLFQYSKNILDEFKDTKSYKFFSNYNDAFEMRIVDKYLWILAQEDTHFDNKVYLNLIKISKE
jgi:hypothetical protein